MSEIVITGARVVDLRFPTSKEHIGSDAVNTDPDYSAAYCILETNAGLEGHGLTFTLGRGTDLVAGVWKGGKVGTFRGLRQGAADYGAAIAALGPGGRRVMRIGARRAVVALGVPPCDCWQARDHLPGRWGADSWAAQSVGSLALKKVAYPARG